MGYGVLPVRIELWSAEPPADPDDWEHVVEASLELSSGRVSLEGVEGPADSEPLEVAAGVYRLRSSAAGLDSADEMQGGDRYRVQLRARSAALVADMGSGRCDRASHRARRSRPSRRGVHDARMRMRWLAARGAAHLFEDSEGTLWEHSNLPDAAVTPQLEELCEADAERR